ncbi:cell envelope biogenesis protein OmpA [Roseococcus sp. DSY-14]|uniref:cell envelope biogenesis protein OmpA n=1 Tax=Roseococcus sp. DSY-14 TaxID=3369650 RepID=UPI00387B8D48
MTSKIRMAALGALALGTAACTNPYDPGQRALGGAALGAGGGALIGGLAGGGSGAAIGAVAGGLGGAAVGAATTPSAPAYSSRRRGYRSW